MKKDNIADIPLGQIKRQPVPFDICTLAELYDRFEGSLINLFQPHRIKFHGLTIITSGKGTHFVDFEKRIFTPGTILPSLKGQVHAFEKERKVSGIVISFDESFISGGMSESSLFHFLHLYYTPHLHIGEENIPEVRPFIQQLTELQKNTNPNLKAALIQTIFTSLILQIKRHTIYQHKTFQSQRYKDFVKFQELISKHYTETHNAHDYAKMMHVSYKYLNDVCKEMVKKTPRSLINSYLILEIKRKLTENKYTSQEIAFDTGFNDPSNFIRFFKKEEKITPSKFSKNHLG